MRVNLLYRCRVDLVSSQHDILCQTNPTFSLQTSFILQGALEVSECSQNSRLGSALSQIPDMNGDGFGELVVGAPLEDDHQGAVYVFYGQDKSIQHQYRQVMGSEPVQPEETF